MKSHRALLVIDAQVNMFDPARPVHQAPELLEKLISLLSLARAAQSTVVFVMNNGVEGDPDIPHTPGWLLHPELPITMDDIIVQKDEMDAFEKTNLHQQLQGRGVKEVIIAGLQSEYCIATNCRKAHSLGYKVTLVSDAHSTYDSTKAKASEISQTINSNLKGLIQLWALKDLA